MSTFALVDVVSPYVVGDAALGEPVHELLSALFVTQIETAFDDNGVCISGIARFSADVGNLIPRFTPPFTITWNPKGTVDHRTQRSAGAYWDFPDIAIAFRLTAPRASSPVADLVVSGGGGGVPTPLANAKVGAILTNLGQGSPVPGALAADSIGTLFHLDLLIDAATLHLPFFTGALLQPDGLLAPDPAHPDVTVTLPKIKLSLEQTAGAVGGAVTDPVVSIRFDSWAAHDIVDPAGAGYGELIRMDPPYALIGPDAVLGFGVNSIVLDLSGTETPPALLEKFGVGDDFRGMYFPDVRVFVKPPGLHGLGIDVSARELLVGLGPAGGVSSIFGLDIVKPDAPQSVTVTIYDEFGGIVDRVALPDVADPHLPAPPFISPVLPAPQKSQWVVDVAGGQPPYNIRIDGQEQLGVPIVVMFAPGTTSRTIPIDILDVHIGGQSRHADIRVALLPPSLSAPEGGIVIKEERLEENVLVAGPAGFGISIVDAPTQERVSVFFTPPDATATVSLGGAAPIPLVVTAGRAALQVAHGATVDIFATWTVAATPPNTPVILSAQYQYDQPRPAGVVPETEDDAAWPKFAADEVRFHTTPSQDEPDPEGTWIPGGETLDRSAQYKAFVDAAKATPATPIELTGMASKENVPLVLYNLRLSTRRIWTLHELLKNSGVTNDIVKKPLGEQGLGGAGVGPVPGRGAFRRVDASIVTGGKPVGTNASTLRLKRGALKRMPDNRMPPVIKREAVGSESWRFKEFHLRVVIDHNRLIAVEIRVKIDIVTVLEQYLKTVQQQEAVAGDGSGSTHLPIGKLSDPNDGVFDMRVQLTLDDTLGRWQALASFWEDDSDGFLQTPPPKTTAFRPAAENFWRDYLGIMIALAPLVDASASSSTVPGAVAALAIANGVPLAAIALDVVHVPRITLYGGELVVGGDSAGTRAALLLDVEVALIVVLKLGGTKLIDTDPAAPITIRYKAVGFATSDKPRLRDFFPVFDSSKGYTVNIPSGGGIKVPAPLGDILQIAGTRIARSNPINIELDLELKADLGVVSIDKTTIRIPLEGGHAPTISALGVHIDVSGAIVGGGYLAIFPDGFAGQLDVSLPGLGVRVAAGLSIRNVTDPLDANHTATAVLVTLEVDFPVPIALGASGLGIYGFGGLFAHHFKRDERPGDPVPALDWLERVKGNPLDIAGWVPHIDDWAIGLGALLGTMDAGFTLNVKGMLIFEMPGPRILLVMKANIIWIRPPRKGNPTAAILAIIDIDLGRGRITIGLTFDYAIKPLLSIHLPVRAIFPFDDLPHFAIDVGTWYNPGTVTFFDLFKARGYFMIRGKGLPDAPGPGSYDATSTVNFPLAYPLGGFALATGVSVSYLWGNRSSGLYLSVGSSVDVGIGFSPIMFTGTLKLWGELHLWVIGIEASAQLEITAGQVPDGPIVQDPEFPTDPTKKYQPTKGIVRIDGEVHGEIDMFFFTISGSVHVSLGTKPDSPPAPPPLVTGVSLQSRAAALLSGVSSDRPIDGKLVDARGDASAIPDAEAVPIDAIVVLHFDCTPRVNTATFVYTQPSGTTNAPIPFVGPSTPSVRRGETSFAYHITSITLDKGLTAGEAPSVWWPNVPKPDAESKRELALLTRVPDAHPSAVERSRHAKDLLKQHWGTICRPAAPPAPVLWTFHDAPQGPSATGWILTGTAWPDPTESDRTKAPPLRLDVAETWRTGDALADFLNDTAPARVIGASVPCAEGCAPLAIGNDPRDPVRQPIIADAMPFGNSAEELSALVAVLAPDRGGDPLNGARSACYARVLEAPFRRAKVRSVVAEHPLGELIADLFAEAARANPESFDDVVAFSAGELASVRFLLYVPKLLLESGALQMRCFATDGTLLVRLDIDGVAPRSRAIATRADVPKRWLDPSGPWRCRVEDVLALVGVPDPVVLERNGRVVLVDSNVPKGTSYVQFGVRDIAKFADRGLGRPSYLIGIVEFTSAAEVERTDIETTIKTHERSAINGALSANPNPPALLLANTEYTVTVAWEYAPCDEGGANVKAWNTQSQSFRFRTDAKPLAPRVLTSPGEQNPRTMPVRLDPWVLSTDPADGERFYFHHQPIRIVFSVDYLLAMFATYGVTLEARVRAASFKNASPASTNYEKTFAALVDARTAVDASAINTKPLVGSAVLTPWEDMVRDVLAGQPCVDTSGDVTRQTIVDLNLLLEPRTDFILEIEPKNAPVPTPGTLATPLFRRAFSTSRYADPQEMCADVGASRYTELPCEPAAAADLIALVGLPAPLSPARFDDALRKAGLRPVVDTKECEIEVLWILDAGKLQPRIIVIRTPEPLVRVRMEPEKVEPPGQKRLQREVIHLVEKPYLEVVATPGVPGAPALHVVSQPNLNLVVVVVDAGRNAPIALSVRRQKSPFLGEGSGTSDIGLFQMTLAAAVWENV